MTEEDVKLYLQNLHNWVEDNMESMDDKSRQYYSKILSDIKGENKQ